MAGGRRATELAKGRHQGIFPDAVLYLRVGRNSTSQGAIRAACQWTPPEQVKGRRARGARAPLDGRRGALDREPNGPVARSKSVAGGPSERISTGRPAVPSSASATHASAWAIGARRPGIGVRPPKATHARSMRICRTLLRTEPSSAQRNAGWSSTATWVVGPSGPWRVAAATIEA